MAKIFLVVGAVLLLVGLVMWLFPNALGWFGHLPGDVRYESSNKNVRVYAPFVSMLVLSIVLTIILNFFRH